MLKIIFGQMENISSLTLPLLVYHPTQILLGSALVPWLQNWVKNSPGATTGKLVLLPKDIPPSHSVSPRNVLPKEISPSNSVMPRNISPA